MSAAPSIQRSSSRAESIANGSTMPTTPIRTEAKAALNSMAEAEKVETVRPTTGRSVDWDDYFSGPCDPTRHSKLPLFMRLHGSILPKMIIPIIFVGGWAAAVTIISKKVRDLSVDSVLLTVLGFVVGLSLSFRSSTAYERYAEGRKFWTQMILHARNLGRIIWIHVDERPDKDGKEDMLKKLSAINLIVAFAQAVKHKLRHEPEYDYADLKPLIDQLDSLAKSARSGDVPANLYNDTITRTHNKPNWGEYLGIPFTTSNPRKALKLAARRGIDHGNLPYEITNYIGAYLNSLMKNGTMTAPVLHTQAFNSLAMLLDAFGGCERVLATPLPIAYNIAISQITWLYVMVLPFQLYPRLDWITIPGTVVAAYIILGIAAIGREIENPFGRDVNDLDLDRYCSQLAYDLHILTSSPPPKPDDFMANSTNLPLWPYSLLGYSAWRERELDDIRNAAKGRLDHKAVGISEENKRVETWGRGMA